MGAPVPVETLKGLLDATNALMAATSRLSVLLDEALLQAGYDAYPPTCLPENVTRLSDRRRAVST
ncbi:hypothetical protein ACFYUV_03865 [Nonomuraea sp. NPDC003560]|uniref:hypothetical protein n=1 Tax=Nonomuraea sp. NPDC003560 TaxID=3364341 RepID=UPI0036CE72D7